MWFVDTCAGHAVWWMHLDENEKKKLEFWHACATFGINTCRLLWWVVREIWGWPGWSDRVW